MRSTIQNIHTSGLCCNCGTCAGMCPQEAITMELGVDPQTYEPQINNTACTGCGICYDVCPGHRVDFKGHNLDIFGRGAEDIVCGSYLNCYLGHAVEPEIRFGASSGGVVTGLLIYALEKKIIDGAIVTRMNKARPWEPEPFIARTREDLIEASTSKYCPVPVNLLIRELLSTDEYEKFAVVGLPCHIHGLRNVEKINIMLKKKIVLHVGIFCSHNDTFWQTTYLLKGMGASKHDLESIHYRGKGWPGFFSVRLKSGKEISIPYRDSIIPHILWFNSMNRCLYCCDITAELADISVGDPWIKEVMAVEKKGQSLIIVRTNFARNLILDASTDECLKTVGVETEKVKESISMGTTKKIDVQVRSLIRKGLGKNVPEYNIDLVKPRPYNYFRGLIPLFSSVLSSNKQFRPLGERIVNFFIR